MALELKPISGGFDKTGAQLFIIDGTGVYSTSNPGGYGFPNTAVGDINRLVFTASNFNSKDIIIQTYVRVADPLHPEWMTSPTINQITSGTPIVMSSMNIINPTPFPVPFSAGVVDINMYAILNTVKTGVVGLEGNPYVEGNGLDAFLVYDSVYINNKLYDIDKTKSTSGGTVLWFIQELTEDATQFSPAYRGNLKVLNDKPLVEKLYNTAAKQAMCCGDDWCDLMLNLHRELAQISFEAGDNGTASTLLGKHNCC